MIEALLAFPQLLDCLVVDDFVENTLDAFVILLGRILRSYSKG